MTVTPDPITATAGVTFLETVATITDSNPSPGNIFSATINWGDGVHTNSPATVEETSSGNFDVLGQFAYARPGNYDVVISVADSNGDPIQPVSSVPTVKDATLTLTPVIISPTAGQLFSGTVANFTDPNPSARASDFIAAVNWGDGTAPTLSTVVANAGGFSILDSHIYAAAGSFETVVEVRDILGTQVFGVASVAVVKNAPVTVLKANAAQQVVVQAGQAIPPNTTIGSFVDTSASFKTDTFAATISWGDGFSSPGTISEQGSTNTFNVIGTHTYVGAGSYTPTIFVTDQAGDSTTIQGIVSVTGPVSPPAPILSAVGIPISVPVGQPFTKVVSTFTDSNSSDTASLLNAVIFWGDGHTTTGTIIATGPGQFSVLGSNTYTTPGLASITVDITGPNGEKANSVATATVTSPATIATGVTFTVTPGQLFTGTVASFTDSAQPIPGFSAVINWGNGATTIGSVVPVGTGQYVVIGSFEYTTAAPTGTFPVTVTISDTNGQSTVAHSTALIANSTPTATFTGGLVGSSGSNSAPFPIATNTDQPTFQGTAPAFSLVQLFARPTNVDANIPIGQTVATSAGTWSQTVGPLADGYYTITAVVTPPGSDPIPAQPLANNGLVVVDTAAPRVVSVKHWGSNGQVLVTFQDSLSGLNPASLLNPANYDFVGPHLPVFQSVAAAIQVSGPSPTDEVSILVTPSASPKISRRATGLRLTGPGIRDIAGNLLQASAQGSVIRIGAAARPTRAPARRRI